MKFLLPVVFISLFSFISGVQAAPTSYWSVGGAALSFDDGVDTVEPFQVFGRIGHDFTEYFGVGGEVTASLVEDELYGLDYSVTAGFIYIRGIIPLADGSKIYGMVGPTNVELTGSSGSVSASVDDDDIGYGFGYEKRFNSNAVSVDYVLYNDDEGVDVYAVNIGYVAYF